MKKNKVYTKKCSKCDGKGIVYKENKDGSKQAFRCEHCVKGGVL